MSRAILNYDVNSKEKTASSNVVDVKWSDISRSDYPIGNFFKATT